MPATIEEVRITLNWKHCKRELPWTGSAIWPIERVVRQGELVEIDPASPTAYWKFSEAHKAEPPRAFATIVLYSEQDLFDLERDPPIVDGWVIYSDPLGWRYKQSFSFIAKPVWGKEYRRVGGRAANRDEAVI